MGVRTLALALGRRYGRKGEGRGSRRRIGGVVGDAMAF